MKKSKPALFSYKDGKRTKERDLTDKELIKIKEQERLNKAVRRYFEKTGAKSFAAYYEDFNKSE